MTVTNQERINSRALIIFAKKPTPGAAKTRLTPPLTPEAASELYACMMLDTLEMASALSGLTPFIFFQSDSGANEYFDALAPQILALPQQGVNLGERMQSAFREIFGRGFSNIAIIGTDSPDLPAEYIFEAFALLEYEHTDVVFGPAADGGYYLLAMKRVWDELFKDLPWSSAKLLAASVEKAKDSCLGVSFLPEWHDIDTEEDLNRPELLDEKSPAIKTREFIIASLLISRLQPDNQQL